MPFFARHYSQRCLLIGSALCTAFFAAGCSVVNPAASKQSASAAQAGNELSVPSFAQWASEAWKRYNTKAAPPARVVPSPRVFENRNATRPIAHPAWQLAQTLENQAPLRFEIPAATIFQLAARQNGPIRIGDVSALQSLRGDTNSTDNLVTNNSSATARALGRWQLSALEARTVTAQTLPALQNQIEARQINDFDAVLAQSLSAQDKARTNIERSLEAALQDDIALARRLAPDALEPYLPSEMQALALSNLRLDLLPALDKTAAETQSSNAERVRRDIAIRAVLREQELARRNALKRLREDLPVQLEATKREELRQTLRVQNQRDQQLRDQARQEARALIAQDFTADAARLGIVLPAQSRAELIASSTDTAANVEELIGNLKRTGNQSGASWRAGQIKISRSSAPIGRAALKTNFDRTALENGALDNGQAPQRARQSEILQTLARHDARQWRRISARRDRAWQAKAQAKPTPVAAQDAAKAKNKAARP